MPNNTMVGCFGVGVNEAEYQGVVLCATASPLYHDRGPFRLVGGNLGQDAGEAADVALSWFFLNRPLLDSWLKDDDPEPRPPTGIHVHIGPQYAHKQGRSLGCAIAVAAISAMYCRPVPMRTLVTGKLDLRGNVLPVGGLQIKVACAKAGGFTKVIIPMANWKQVQADMRYWATPLRDYAQAVVVPVATMVEVLKAVYGADDTLGDPPEQLVMGLGSETLGVSQSILVGEGKAKGLFVEAGFVRPGTGRLLITGPSTLRDQVMAAISIIMYLDVHSSVVEDLGGKTGLSDRLSLHAGDPHDLHVNYSPDLPAYESHAALAVLSSLLSLVTGASPTAGAAVVGELSLTGHVSNPIRYPCGTDFLQLCRHQRVTTLLITEERTCNGPGALLPSQGDEHVQVAIKSDVIDVLEALFGCHFKRLP